MSVVERVGPMPFYRSTIVIYVAAIVVLAIVLVAVSQLAAPGAGVSSGPRQVVDLGREHIDPNIYHPPYNSTPPTSGWHYPYTVEWGVHDRPIPDEYQVHNLEHGDVIIHYNCPTPCPDLVAQLTNIAKSYPERVVLAPYPTMRSRIALTAWTWIDEFDRFDQRRIVEFIQKHRNQGPERFG